MQRLKKKKGRGGYQSQTRAQTCVCVFMLQLLYIFLSFFKVCMHVSLLISFWVLCLWLLFLCGGGEAVGAIRTLLRGTKTLQSHESFKVFNQMDCSDYFSCCSPSPGPDLVCLGGIFAWKRPVSSGRKSPNLTDIYMLIRQHQHGSGCFSPSSSAAPHLWTLTCSSHASVGKCWWDTGHKWGH